MGLPNPSHFDRHPSRPTGEPRVDERRRDDGARELVLLKQNQRYLFTCAAGEEATLLDRLRQMARDPDSGIDWFDAALLSHQLGARLSQRLRERSVSTDGPDAPGGDSPSSDSNDSSTDSPTDSTE